MFEYGLFIRQMPRRFVEGGWMYKPGIDYQEKYKDEMNI
jgi:hypothetical protein